MANHSQTILHIERNMNIECVFIAHEKFPLPKVLWVKNLNMIVVRKKFRFCQFSLSIICFVIKLRHSYKSTCAIKK